MGQSQSRGDLPNQSPTSARSKEGEGDDQALFPDPSGHEYDEIDKLQAELPPVIDEESRQQVDDYVQACDNGKGPMVACFATAEYISMFERRVSAVMFFKSTTSRQESLTSVKIAQRSI